MSEQLDDAVSAWDRGVFHRQEHEHASTVPVQVGQFRIRSLLDYPW